MSLLDPHAGYTDLVGYLVGCIMPRSNPLIFSLYSQPDGRHSVRVTQDTSVRDAGKAATRLGFLMEPALVNVFVNTSHPRWYYLCLDPNHGPASLNQWDAPWSVYTDWRTRGIGE